MITYTDAEVRDALLKLKQDMTWRRFAKEVGIDFANLYRQAHGDYEISPEVGAFAGFELIDKPRKWRMKP
jgi:hypothetical protein